MASKYKGVESRPNGSYRVHLSVGGKCVSFGTYKDAALAAKARDRYVCGWEHAAFTRSS